ncbi:MAG TPA: hypothetical protein VNE39_26720 [Planctomycetota bacterium]|nr:hypothetical protein [Planctomycetota bacterium]
MSSIDRSRDTRQESQKISTGMLLNSIASTEQRFVARELHEALLDLPRIWAPSEVFAHESISYRLNGRAFVHMAPPLETDRTEVHVLEGPYALPTLLDMVKHALPSTAEVVSHPTAPHRHTKGGEIIIRVDRETVRDVYRFLLQLYRRECGY